MKAKYLNIVFDKTQLSNAFFRNDRDDESNAAEMIHKKIENIFIYC